MGNLPVVQEVTTAVMVTADALCGDFDKAEERLNGYAEQSVIGSLVVGTAASISGDKDEAKKYFKGCGRATGRAVLGGGLLENVPVFQELSVLGKSLGEVIAGDPENVHKHGDDYVDNSVIGSLVGACVEESNGNYGERDRLLKNSGKALISAGVTAGTIGVTVVTGGLAAPLGAGAAAATGATMGVGTSTIAQATNDLLYNEGKPSSGGDYVGGALLGGVMGAVSGAEQAKAYQKQVTSRLDASRMERHQNLIKGFKEEHDGFTSTTIHDKSDFKGSHGYNRGLRNKFEDGKDLRGKPLYKNSEAKIKQVAKKSEYGNAKGSVSYPKGYPNVEEAAKNPKVLNKLSKNGEKWVVQNCAEPHALETFKANNPNLKVDASYTLEVKNGKEYIKAPCGNCKAMGEVNLYGRVPFEKYDGMPVNQAIEKHVGNANAARFRADLVATLSSAENVTMDTDEREDD